MAEANRRSYGTGSLYVRKDAAGRESWYGRWYSGPTRIKRRIGPKRPPGSRDGLTRGQAEAELRRRIEVEAPSPTRPDLTIEQAGDRLLRHLNALGRKPTTLGTYGSLFRTHLVPRVGSLPVERATPGDVEELLAAMRRDGKGAKTIVNALTLLSQIFKFAERKGWATANPCARVDRPQIEDNADIHYLEMEEIEALLRAVPSYHPLGPTDRVLYLTAAMTGFRQGELLGLRWRDVDWAAGRIRERQNYVRGHWGTPKSRRGSRAVPMVDRVAGELERHFQRSAYRGDDDLVFCNPHTGRVLDHSALSRRYKKALGAAALRQVRFNDLRHTFGTRMAAAGVPMRTLQEWMGHRDFKTTLIYADYAPSEHEAEMAERAFRGPVGGPNLSETDRTEQTSHGLTKPD